MAKFVMALRQRAQHPTIRPRKLANPFKGVNTPPRHAFDLPHSPPRRRGSTAGRLRLCRGLGALARLHFAAREIGLERSGEAIPVPSRLVALWSRLFLWLVSHS